jgi:uncharacterized protein YvpB
LKNKAVHDSSDRFLLQELEELIIRYNMEYVELEDKNLDNIQSTLIAENIKKIINSNTYPLKELSPEMVESVYSNVVIVSDDAYAIIINASGKKLFEQDFKKAMAQKPLLTSKSKSRNEGTYFLHWSIYVC